jgi:hypothetical protein
MIDLVIRWYLLLLSVAAEDKYEQNKNKNSNILDERASLKVGLQVEQGNFPQGKDILTGYHVWRLGVKS